MPQDKSRLETIVSVEDSSAALNSTTLINPPGLIGQILDGRYLIERLLGQGGVGAVYLAHDRKLHDKSVVVKVLLEKSLQNAWVVQKFQQEKEALTRVDHPGVVGILDTGELPDQKPYIVMQYIDGIPLRDAIKAKPEGMDLERAASIIKQSGAALGAVHQKKIYHRDLKPENIMLQALSRGHEQVKIVDFGVARVKGSAIAPSTVTGAATAGTIVYMSPEQLRGEKVTAASDIYSLAVIAYEMVTGRRPFNPDTTAHLAEMQRHGVRAKPTDLRPRLPEEAQAIMLKALAFDPHARDQNAAEFGEALARALMNEDETLKLERKEPAAEIPPTQLAKAPLSLGQATVDESAKRILATFEPSQTPVFAQPGDTSASLPSRPPRFSVWLNTPWLKVAVSFVFVAAFVTALSAAFYSRKWFVARPTEQSGTAPSATQVNQDTPPTVPAKLDLVKIEGGTFQMGRSDLPSKSRFDLTQYPAHPVGVKTFWMDKTEVTNAEYADFVLGTKYSPPSYWRKGTPPSDQEQWPVTNVSLYDAKAFAEWRAKRDGVKYRLPTEEEWEYAARNGSQATLYPWGNQWLDDCANVDANSLKPVGTYPQGASRWGVLDLIGNAWEWTSTEAALYPGNTLLVIPKGEMIIRGGAYVEPSRGPEAITATRRSWVAPSAKEAAIGFRLVRDGP